MTDLKERKEGVSRKPLRVLAFAMALVLLAGILPMTAFAAAPLAEGEYIVDIEVLGTNASTNAVSMMAPLWMPQAYVEVTSEGNFMTFYLQSASVQPPMGMPAQAIDITDVRGLHYATSSSTAPNGTVSMLTSEPALIEKFHIEQGIIEVKMPVEDLTEPLLIKIDERTNATGPTYGRLRLDLLSAQATSAAPVFPLQEKSYLVNLDVLGTNANTNALSMMAPLWKPKAYVEVTAAGNFMTFYLQDATVQPPMGMPAQAIDITDVKGLHYATASSTAPNGTVSMLSSDPALLEQFHLESRIIEVKMPVEDFAEPLLIKIDERTNATGPTYGRLRLNTEDTAALKEATAKPTFPVIEGKYLVDIEVLGTNANTNAVSMMAPLWKQQAYVEVTAAGNFMTFYLQDATVQPPMGMPAQAIDITDVKGLHYATSSSTAPNGTVSMVSSAPALLEKFHPVERIIEVKMPLDDDLTEALLIKIDERTNATGPTYGRLRLKEITAKPVTAAPLTFTGPAGPLSTASLTGVATTKGWKTSTAVVKWASVPSADGYLVSYRMAGKGQKWTTVKISDAQATSTTFSGLKINRKYYFRVAAYRNATLVDEYTETAWSKVGAVTPRPAQPSALSLKKTGSRSMTIKWSRVPGASGYQVFRKSSTSGWKNIKTIKNSPIYRGALTKGKQYDYKVRAFRVIEGKRIYSPFTAVKSIRL